MNHIFRLVWNFSLQCFVVAPETARTRSKNSAGGARKSLLLPIIAGVASTPFPALSAADVVPVGNATKVYNSPNGVPVVDIKNPNKRGLSHNKYTGYNVASQGLILNNNAGNTALQSQLAGQVLANQNLDKAATLILNEVVASNRSTLAGYTEVVGSTADVVVANPWGVTCNGCGFINVDRVSFTTGTPDINGGMLTGFNVQQGSVLINGSGANLSAQQIFDVVARTIKVKGQINANDLKLVAGSNDWNYEQRTANAIASEELSASYSIDSSMLGGMYAGQIQLISTEAGVGVRMLGDAAASADDFSITADGRIKVDSRLSAQRDLTLTSTSSGSSAINLVDATLSAQRDVELNAALGGANLRGGSITAGRDIGIDVRTLSDRAGVAAEDDSNKRYAGSDLALIVAENALIADVAYGAGNELVATTGALTLAAGSAAVYTETGMLNLSAAADMKLNNAAVISATGISLTADAGVISTGQGPDQVVQAQKGDVQIRSGEGVLNAGIISADEGQVVVSADGAISNVGELYARRAVILEDQAGGFTGEVTNSGTILSDGSLSIRSSLLNNSGGIQGTGRTDISANTLTNDGLMIVSNSDAKAGKINALRLTNTGTIQSADRLRINVDDTLDNSGELLAAADLRVLGSNSAGALSVTNSAGGVLQAGDQLIVAAATSGGNVSVTNASGSTFLAQQLKLDITALTNAGTIQGQGSSNIAVQAMLTNSIGGELLLSDISGSGVVTAAALSNSGILQSAGALEMTIADEFVSSGIVQGENTTSLVAATVDNSGTMFLSNTAGQAGAVSADSVVNTGTIQSAESINFTVARSLINAGVVLADNSLSITGGNTGTTLAVTNTNTAVMQSLNTISLSGLGGAVTLTNDTGSRVSTDRLNIRASALYNSGIIDSSSSSVIALTNVLDNKAGGQMFLSSSRGTSQVSANTLNNVGLLSSAGNFDINVTSEINNSGTIQGNVATTLVADTIDNSGQIVLSLVAGQHSSIWAKNLFSSGLLQSGGSLDLNIANQFSLSDTLLVVEQLAIEGIDFVTGSQSVIDAGDLSLDVGSLSNAGTLRGRESLNISTATSLTNSVTGVVQGDKVTTITAESVDNSGLLVASNTLDVAGTLAADSLANSGTIQSGGSLSLQLRNSLDNENAILAAQDLTIQGSQSESRLYISNEQSGVIQAGNTLAVSGLSGNNDVSLDNYLGTISADLLDLNLSELANDGSIQSTGAGDIYVAGQASNGQTGQILFAGTTGSDALNANVLSNDGVVQSAGNFTVRVDNDLTNIETGVIQSSGMLDMNVGNKLSNLGGLILADVLSLYLGELGNSGTLQSQTGESVIDVTGTAELTDSGRILLAMADTPPGGSNGGRLDFGNEFVNKGVLHSNGSLHLTAPAITNNAGISALGTLEVGTRTEPGALANLNNKKTLYAGASLLLSANVIHNSGDIQSDDLIDIASTQFTNTGEIVADGDIDLTAEENFTNKWDEIYQPEIVESVTNAGTIAKLTQPGCEFFCDPHIIWIYEEEITTEEVLSNTAWALDANATATILSGGAITLKIGKQFINSGAATIFAGTDLKIDALGFENSAFSLAGSTAKKRYAAWEVNSAAADGPIFITYFYAATESQWDSKPKFAGSLISFDVPWLYPPVNSFESASSNAVPLKSLSIPGPDLTNAIVGAAAGDFTLNSKTAINEGSATPVQAQTYCSTNPADCQDSTRSESLLGADSLFSAAADAVQTVIDGATVGSQSSRIDGADLTAIAGAAAASGGSELSITGVDVTLPTNPFGYFVPSEDPNSNFLVETNPLFSVGLSSVGSDFLAQRFGYDPDETLKRVGDSNYELYLIRQQLITQTGRNLLDGYSSEVDLVRGLMEQGADEATNLDMTWGVAPTAEQLSLLTEDIVWMVEMDFDGQRAIVPQVFLSAATRNSIATGAVIAATNIDMNVESFTNTGGTVTASGLLDIESQLDITNTSGSMRGGDVILTSTEGSVINQTAVEGAGDELSYDTQIGRTASIESVNTLVIDAQKDIKVVGADLSAGGPASLAAGDDVTFDTIVDKTVTTNAGVATKEGGTLATAFTGTTSGETSTTTDTERNTGSNVNIGGQLSISSGGDTVIAGSDVEVGGGLDVETGGNFEVIARQDKTTTHTVSTRSGTGVGGGLYGTEKVTTDTFKGTNVGSALDVAGDARVASQGEVVVQGSDVDVVGDGNIYGKEGISILDGLDEETSTVVTETTALMKGESGSKSGSATGSAGGLDANGVTGEARANATAYADNESNMKLVEVSVETQRSGSTTSVASNLNVGGGLTLSTDEKLVIQGSNVDVTGAAQIDAKSVDVLAGRNESWSETTTQADSFGLYSDSEADAKAGVEAVGKTGLGGLGDRLSAEATAEAGAETTGTFGGRTEFETVREDTVTNVVSSIRTGGTLTIDADETVTFAGAAVDTGGKTTINATDIKNIAVQDTYTRTSSSDQTTAGLYVGANAAAEAEAKADGNRTGGGAGGGVKGELELEGGIRMANETESRESGTVTNIGNTFTSGAGFERNAENTILDQGTKVVAVGPITQTATTIVDEAVHDRVYSSEESNSAEVRVGAYADASAEVNGEASARAVGRKGGDVESGTDAGAGFKGQLELEEASASNETRTAVTSSFTSGSSITSISEDKTSLEGTQFVAGTNIAITAGELDYKAAQDSSTVTSASQSGGVEGKVAVYGNAGAKAEGEYAVSDTVTNTSTARTGSASAGGNLIITTTKGGATFEGTDLEGRNSAAIDSAGGVNFEAARNTETTTEVKVEAELSVSGTKGSQKSGLDSGNESFGGEIEGEYADVDNDTAVVGSITSGSGGTSITSTKTVTLEGTQLESAGATEIAAEVVDLKAAVSTTSDTKLGGSLEAGMGVSGGRVNKTGDVEGGVALDVTYAAGESSKVTSIKSGDGVTITAGVINNQEAVLESGAGSEPELNGSVIEREAENSEDSFSFGTKQESGTD
ncbi:MAG: hemagglutinin repeat-containing protein [Halioglobus sp.]